MKKNTFNFILYFSITSLLSCSNQESQVLNDLHLQKLKGSVKSVSMRNIEGNFYSNKTFNQKGYEVSSENNESDFPIQIIYKRDLDNNIIEKREEGSSEGDKYKILTTYKYNKSNKPIESKVYNLDGSLIDIYTYEYNENGDLIQENRTYSTQGAKYSRNYRLEYDKLKRITNKIELSALPYNPSQEIYEYDNTGNLISRKVLKSDGTITSINLYKYDDKKNILEEQTSYENSISLFSKVSNNYDNENNLIEEKHFNNDGGLSYISKYEFEFDNFGNWIKRKDIYIDRHSTSKISGGIERTIEYY